MIFEDSALRKISRLALVASRIRAGRMKGERRSTRRGGGVEFADYRGYVPGDDLRRLDWNIYARLDKPFIKLMEEEEDLAVYVLLDGSRSMDWGEGTRNKFRYALNLAAGLGAIALSSGDAFSFGFLQHGQVGAEFGPTRGAAALPRLLQFLESLQADGQTDLNQALRAYAVKPRRAGLLILISDLLTESGFEAGLNPFLGRGYEAVLIHLLAPEEIDPPLAGDLRLVDAETGAAQEVSIDGGLRSFYKARVREWIQSVQDDCRKRAIKYLSVVADKPWDQVLLLEMRKARVVK